METGSLAPHLIQKGSVLLDLAGVALLDQITFRIPGNESDRIPFMVSHDRPGAPRLDHVPDDIDDLNLPRTAINQIANPTMPEVGERYLGTVVKTTTFGAFVSLVPGRDGLLHISEVKKMAGKPRIESVEEVLKVGDKVQVEIKEIDSRGKLSLVPVTADSEG